MRRSTLIYKIRIEYDREATTVPDSDLEYTIDEDVPYTQADNNAIDRKLALLQSGRVFNNVMFNLAYNANADEIGELSQEKNEDEEDGSYEIDNTEYVSSYITSVKRASASEYNAARSSLSSSELINLSLNAEKKQMIYM